MKTVSSSYKLNDIKVQNSFTRLRSCEKKCLYWYDGDVCVYDIWIVKNEWSFALHTSMNEVNKKLILLQKTICMRSQKTKLWQFDWAVYYLCVYKLLIRNNKLLLKYGFWVYKVTHSSFEWWMKWRKTQTQIKSGHIISQNHTRNSSKK